MTQVWDLALSLIEEKNRLKNDSSLCIFNDGSLNTVCLEYLAEYLSLISITSTLMFILRLPLLLGCYCLLSPTALCSAIYMLNLEHHMAKKICCKHSQ